MSQKKGKKKSRRKDDDWEDEVTNELEQMQLSGSKDILNKNEHVENNDDVADKTKKKKRKSKKDKEAMDSDEGNVSNKDERTKSAFGLLDVEDTEEDNEDDKVGDEIRETKSKKVRNNSKKEITDEDNDINITEITKTESSGDIKANSGDEDDFKKEKIKGKKGKDKKVVNENEEDEEPVMKTAAQKRAEKKERDKKKKEAQRKKTKDVKPNKKENNEEDGNEGLEEVGEAESSKNKETDDPNIEVDNPNIEVDNPNIEVDKVEVGNEQDDVIGEEEIKENEEEEGDDKKKKKKKKKKGKDEDATKTKKPARGVIKQMQEALEKAKLEQERLRQEEEAKQNALEEAENKRLEKIRVEQERKERQKQKEKERKQRLKLEGKLLTKAQKQQKAQTEAMLQAMREQGIEIPNRGEAEQNDVKKPVRYGKKKSKHAKEKSEVIETEQTTEIVADENVTVEEPMEDRNINGQIEEDVKIDLKTENIEIVEDADEVKDTWEKDTWDDDEEHKIEDDIELNTTNKEKDIVETDEENDDNEDKESSEEEENEDEEESSEEEDSASESEEDDSLSKEEREFERAKARIKKRREKAEINRTKDKLRSPVICVMGHVDTGKTKILDKIRHSNVQDGEAGGITQQIGATNVPSEAIRQQTKMIKEFCELEMKIPALLIIDTPGHESFSNLRSRGSTLCDMAILVVDIMHGLEPQTIESINLLRAKKTPFIVALNKIDRLFEWKRGPNSSIVDTLKKQNRNTKLEFEERLNNIISEFAAEGLNATLFNKNVDTKTYISLVPTSAHSGDGMGDLIALIVTLCQTKLTRRLAYSEELQCTVLEVKAITGLGTTVDVILTNGRLAESQTIILGGIDGPIVTQVRALLMPQPLKELRVKNQYAMFKEIEAAQGVKITGKELDKALAGSPLFVAYQEDEVEVLKREVTHIVNQSLKAIKVSERGVCVQASTLGSLEALLEFLKTSKIPYCTVSVGPVHKKDVMKASVMLEHDIMFAVILAFDVKVERDAQELADTLGVNIFTADIIYHLFDKFTKYTNELKRKKRDEFKHIAVFPCKLRILSEHIYNSRDPIVVGVTVEAGVVKEGTPICVPSQEFVEAGIVTGIEANHKSIDSATKGMEVCLKIEPIPGEAPKMYGRHFDYTDLLVSKISRESIDAVKEYFRDDLQKSDWQLMIELKKLFKII